MSTRYTEEELRKDLVAVADELGRTPSKDEFNDRGESSATTLRRRFGSWSRALEAAGLDQRMHDRGGAPFTNAKYADLVGIDDDSGGEEA